MQISIGVLRHVVIEHNVHSLNVHSSAEQVGGHKQSLLEVLEFLVSGQSEINKFIILVTFRVLEV